MANDMSEYKGSAQTVKGYCDSKNIYSKSFYYWKRKFSSSTKKVESETSFDELLFRDERVKPNVSEQKAVCSAGIHIQIGKAQLELDRDFDIEEFRRTVEVLMWLSC